MKKFRYLAAALLAIAILIILWKYLGHDSKKPHLQNPPVIFHDPRIINYKSSTNKSANYLKTPKGKIYYAEIQPAKKMVNQFIELGLIDADYQERLARLRPNPWKVFLDDKNHVVKFQIREVIHPTVNNDIEGLGVIEQSYVIKQFGTNQISLSDPVAMKKLYFSIQVHKSFLDNNTEEFAGTNLQEVEMYPVMAQYIGHPNPELRDNEPNLVYLSGKDLPMLLLKTNKGFPNDDDWSTADDASRELLNKYGLKECMEIEWLLLPFPRTEEESKFFANAPIPEHVGTAATLFTPTVKAWERVHGKKYEGP